MIQDSVQDDVTLCYGSEVCGGAMAAAPTSTHDSAESNTAGVYCVALTISQPFVTY